MTPKARLASEEMARIRVAEMIVFLDMVDAMVGVCDFSFIMV